MERFLLYSQMIKDKGLTKLTEALKKLNNLLYKVFVLSKTITGLTKAATDPRKDDQITENSGKMELEYIFFKKHVNTLKTQLDKARHPC